MRGERCNGFVARLAGAARVVRIVEHSDEADPSHDVAACRSCGALHEIVRRVPLASYALND